MFEIKKYSVEYYDIWNNFTEQCRQQSILFHRDYIDYHKDRFIDHSLLFFKNSQLISVLPANLKGDILYSHQGLTFGGLIYPSKVKSKDIISVVELLLDYLHINNFSSLFYNPSPPIYHTVFSEEDIFAFYHSSKMDINSIEISTAISHQNKGRMSSIRKRGIKKAKNSNIEIDINMSNIDDFYALLSSVLFQQHNVKPVHTLNEINYLKKKFPKNIHLWVALKQEKIVAGFLLYESETVVHIQYIAASEEGKKLAALDYLFNEAINHYTNKNKTFEFGKSTERSGTILNDGLIYQKESFGGSAINYLSYKIKVNNAKKK